MFKNKWAKQYRARALKKSYPSSLLKQIPRMEIEIIQKKQPVIEESISMLTPETPLLTKRSLEEKETPLPNLSTTTPTRTKKTKISDLEISY